MASREDVTRKIESTWPDADQRTRVWRALERYGSESSDAGRARVQLAILKLADGSLDRLDEWVEVARRDYRDVLASAEYPQESQAVWALHPTLSASEQARLAEIRERDRQQYLSWLKQ
jgi:hypothetical protein